MNIVYDNGAYLVGWKDGEDRARYEKFDSIKDLVRYLQDTNDVHVGSADMPTYAIDLIARNLHAPRRLEWDDPLTGKVVVYTNTDFGGKKYENE